MKRSSCFIFLNIFLLGILQFSHPLHSQSLDDEYAPLEPEEELAPAPAPAAPQQRFPDAKPPGLGENTITTNPPSNVPPSGEEFKDPFGDSPSAPAPAFGDPAPLTPAPIDPVAPAAPGTPGTPETRPQEFAPSQDFRDPFGAEPAPQAPTQEVDPFATEGLPTSPPLIQQPAPGTAPTMPQQQPMGTPPPTTFDQNKPFNFPEPDAVKGPITQELKFDAEAQLPKKGLWNFGGTLGGAINVNKRYNQIDLQAMGGYRWREDIEFGGVIDLRFVRDILVGFIGTAKWAKTISKTRSWRIDWLPGGGLGWTLREKGGKFVEGRFTFRASSDFDFYSSARFAVVGAIAMDSYIFGLGTDGKANNYFSGGGPPTQLMIMAGARYEF